MVTARGQVLTERRQVFDFQVHGEYQSAVGRVVVLVLIEERDHFVSQQFVQLLEYYAEVRDSVGTEKHFSHMICLSDVCWKSLQALKMLVKGVNLNLKFFSGDGYHF